MATTNFTAGTVVDSTWLNGIDAFVYEVMGQDSVAHLTKTTATYTVAATDRYITISYAGTATLTLPSAATYPSRVINLRTITANTVVSASSNVVPLIGGSAGTAILAATAGKWAELVSDGTNWQIMSGN